METSATPNSSIMNHFRLGRSGGCTNPRPQSWSSSLYSRITNTISSTTPIATNAEKILSQKSKESLDDSRDLIIALSAASSIDKFRKHELLIAKVQLMFVVSVCVGAIVYVMLMF